MHVGESRGREYLKVLEVLPHTPHRIHPPSIGTEVSIAGGDGKYNPVFI